MRVDITEVLQLDEQRPLSLRELAELSRLPETDLLELQFSGAIQPLESGTAQPLFSARYLLTARTAGRLHSDFELDMHGVALVLQLLERLQQLEARLSALQAQQPHR